MMSGESRGRGADDAEAAEADAALDDYVLPLAPEEAKALESSRQLKNVMKLANVKLTIDRNQDGWVSLTIRGAPACIDEAKQRIDAIVTPADFRDVEQMALASGGSLGGGNGGASRAADAAAETTAATGAPELAIATSTLPNGDCRLEIELTNKDQVGAVIGESGRTINAIRRDASVSIQLEAPDSTAASTQRRVVVIGTKEHCAEASVLIRDVLRSNTGKRDYSQRIDDAVKEGGGVLRMTIARHLVGRVIGKRGATIKELRERSGAVIEVAKDDDGVGTVTISGSAIAVNSARVQIEELTQEELPIEVQNTLSRMLDEVLVITVPANRVGKLIGSRGAVIQGLRQQTGATIDLQKDAGGGATCMLRGSMEVMQAAKAEIEKIVAGPA